MAPVKTFKDIQAWQKAHELTLRVYKITENFPKSELFALTSQMRRAAVSVPSNIVEGFKRKSKKDSVHFYNVSEGSLEELKYQLLLARDLEYMNTETHDEALEMAEETGRLINGWISAQK